MDSFSVSVKDFRDNERWVLRFQQVLGGRGGKDKRMNAPHAKREGFWMRQQISRRL
jgi:hypothetical protein